MTEGAEAGPSAEAALLAQQLEIRKHVSFFLRCLRLLPTPYTAGDDQRMTLAYFALAGLDLLSSLDKIPPQERIELIDWVYDQQCLPQGGFRGSPSSGTKTNEANVAMTYSAVLALAILRDDFTRLDRPALLQFIKRLQDPESGGYYGLETKLDPTLQEHEMDPRFTYCATVLWHLLHKDIPPEQHSETESISVSKAQKAVLANQRYDGGFGSTPYQESHSGMTYCSIASLALLSQSQLDWLPHRLEVVSWLAHRQVERTAHEDSDGEEEEQDGGFQGRISKVPADVCYSFWNGAALHILGQHNLIDTLQDTTFILAAQSNVGGIAKVPDDHPDLLHSYLGLAALSLHQESHPELQFGLQPLNPLLNCTVDTAQWLYKHFLT